MSTVSELLMVLWLGDNNCLGECGKKNDGILGRSKSLNLSFGVQRAQDLQRWQSAAASIVSHLIQQVAREHRK